MRAIPARMVSTTQATMGRAAAELGHVALAPTVEAREQGRFVGHNWVEAVVQHKVPMMQQNFPQTWIHLQP